jgi:hypothetical protein
MSSNSSSWLPGADTSAKAKEKDTAVALDLDALEREGAVLEPFTFKYDGETYHMLDPQEIDWQNLLSGLRNPALFVRFAMPVTEQSKFFGKQVPAWKMNALMEAYQQHFGIPDLGNANALRT